jgi:catechol 2,3-dioxygenase-like lactoylglutathione lyase family enzyme
VGGPPEAFVGLDHVQVAAPPGCEDAARSFYGRLLGLEELEKPPLLGRRGGAWFRVGAHELHVGVAEGFAAATKAHPALRVRSREVLEELAGRLAAAGHVVEWADPAEIPGRERFHVHDPWGNRLELLAPAVGRAAQRAAVGSAPRPSGERDAP